MKLWIPLCCILLATTAISRADDDVLSVTLTSIAEYSAGYGFGVTPDECVVEASIDNRTSNHVDQIAAHIGKAEIKLENLRAKKSYDYRFFADASCLQFAASINTNAHFFEIGRCSMEGLKEGDCLQAVQAISHISNDAAATVDSQCRPLYQKYEQQGACSNGCDKYPNGLWNPQYRECYEACKSRFPFKATALCRSFAE